MLEKQIEKQILTYLNYQPDVFAFKVNTVGVYDAKKKLYRKNRNPFLIPGTSDIIGMWRGKFFAIEVKTPKTISRVSPDQINFLQAVNKKMGLTLVACSLEQVIHWLTRLREIAI